MNECQHASKVMAYYDGEIVGQARTDIERHLDECAACRADLERLAALSSILGEAPAPQMPQAALDRLHQSVQRLPSRGVLRLAEFLSAAAAAILVFCAVGLMYKGGPSANAAGLPANWEPAAVATAVDESVDPQDEPAPWSAQNPSETEPND